MSIWKSAIVGAVLLTAACSPVGQPKAEERIAAKIADAMIGDNLVTQVVRQQIQGMMQQGVIQQDQFAQVGMEVGRQLTAELPAVKKTLITSLTKEFNLKELELLQKMLTSKEGHAISEKQDAAMGETMQHIGKLAQEASAKAVSRVNSIWPTGGHAPPPQPQGMPPGMDMQPMPN